MKKIQILIIITLSLLLFYDFSFSQVAIEPKEIDPFLSTIDRLKEEGDFENWPCKNGPIRAGIILSKDDSSALQEAEDNIPNIYIMDWIEGILATQYSYRWTVKEKGIVDVEFKVMQTCLQAQEFLIRRFAESSMPPEAIHLKPDETSELCVEIEAPAGNYVELMPLEEGIAIVTNVTLSNNHILFWHKAR